MYTNAVIKTFLAEGPFTLKLAGCVAEALNA